MQPENNNAVIVDNSNAALFAISILNSEIFIVSELLGKF